MALWKRIVNFFQGAPDEDGVDYYREGIQLLQVGRYHEALTSFRLALRESPADPTILQHIAITYTRIGVTEEAVKMYRGVLDDHPGAVGAHYGLAFLLLREGKSEEAVPHLQAFLRDPPEGPGVNRYVSHARDTLAEVTEGTPDA